MAPASRTVARWPARADLTVRTRPSLDLPRVPDAPARAPDQSGQRPLGAATPVPIASNAQIGANSLRFVPATDGAAPLIVEVWSKSHKQGAVGRRRQWQRL